MPQYDVFISYNRHDGAIVEAIARRLREAGLNPFFDRWSLRAGEPWMEALQEALADSAAAAIFTGPEGLGPWQVPEVRDALNRAVRSPRGAYPLPPRFVRSTWSLEVLSTKQGLELLAAWFGQDQPAAAAWPAAEAEAARVIVELLEGVPLALDRERSEEALPLLEQARQGFLALGLEHWVASMDELLAQAQGQTLTLEDLAAMVQAARRGELEAGEQARAICEALAQADDVTLSALGRGLLRVLGGAAPEEALAELPEELREQVLGGLEPE